MKILEVRDGIVKLESNDELSLSSFIKIDGADKSYIAQTIQLKPAFHTAFAKILFLYENGLKDYDKTSPSEEAVVSDFTSDMIKNSVKYKNPVITGETISGRENLALDFSAFDKKTLIVSDDEQDKNLFIRNLSKQFNNLGKKVVVVDTLGTINADKYTAGKDFKLPLNKASLKFIFEECLNDATADSKNTIVEIFRDLAEYSETVPFVPFAALKSIVDDMVDHSHIFKLLVLKNKLSKYDKFGYFANSSAEAQRFEKILKSDCTIIDVSKMDSVFQNRYISYIYETLAGSGKVIIAELSNAVSKKTLKNIFDSSLATAFVTHSRFKYINDIKSLFENLILFPSEEVNRVFSIYSTFLRSMEKDSYLAVGGGTGYMPFVLKAASYDARVERQIPDEEILDEITKNDSEETPVETYDEKEEASNEIIAEINEKSYDTITDIAENLETPENIDMFGEDEEIAQEEVEILESQDSEQETEVVSEDTTLSEDSTDLAESIDNSNQDMIIDAEIEQAEEYSDEDEDFQTQDEELEEQQEEPGDETILDSDFEELIEPENENIQTEDEQQEFTEPENVVQERGVIPLEEEFSEDEIVELNPEDASPDDILIDMSDDLDADQDTMDEQIKKEVDKVYTTRKEDDFSENDLDFIDELNSEADTLEEVRDDDSLLEELTEQGEIIEEYHSEEPIQEDSDAAGEILETKDSSTPMVPVYDAEIPEEDLVESDPIQQGDSVTHIRFGSGVVEKLVKYGSKTLFMINFDNGGRRLLDPLLTEIKKA